MDSLDTQKVKTVKTECEICCKEAEMRILSMDYGNIRPEVLLVFECENCNTREINILNEYESIVEKVTITCYIDDLSDIQRYVYLSKDSQACFYKNNDVEAIYEFKNFSADIVVIEMLLNRAIAKIEELYKINTGCLDALNQPDIKSIDTGRMSLIDIEEKRKAEQQISMLRKELSNPNLRFVIYDDSGKSRIGPPNEKLPPNFLNKDIDYYNDKKVKHTFEFGAIKKET